MTHLIVSCDEVCDCMEDTSSCKLVWASHHLKVQLLLLCLVAHFTSLLRLFLLLHGSPNVPWHRPMADRYVCGITSFLVDVVMLTDVQATQRIAASMKSLALAVHFDEVLVNPGPGIISEIFFWFLR